jgi:hypothetical protein
VLPVSEAALEEIAIEFLEANGIATTKMGIGADNASNGWFLNVLCICQVAVFFHAVLSSRISHHRVYF